MECECECAVYSIHIYIYITVYSIYMDIYISLFFFCQALCVYVWIECLLEDDNGGNVSQSLKEELPARIYFSK